MDVATRLRARRGEIEEVITARIRHVSPHPTEAGDVSYQEGQVAAVTAVLDYALTGIEGGEGSTRLTPSPAVAQVHRAAQAGVGLETVVRRYTAGYAEFGDFVIQEADRARLLGHGAAMRQVQRTQAWLLDHLIVTVNKEYVLATERIASSPERRRAEHIRRLLAYGTHDHTELDYDFDTWHFGIIGTGEGAARAIRHLAKTCHCQLFWVSHDDQNSWAWLGGDRRRVIGDYQRLSSVCWPAGTSLAVGQPAEGFDGWRLTHQQAQDALLVSLRRPQMLTLYTDIALLAPWLRDAVRARAFVNTYLSPLDNHQCSGQTLRKTLLEYFAAGRNAAKAERNLNVSRRTMRNRMALIRESLDELLESNQAEVELALRLDELL